MFPRVLPSLVCLSVRTLVLASDNLSVGSPPAQGGFLLKPLCLYTSHYTFQRMPFPFTVPFPVLQTRPIRSLPENLP